MRAAHEWVTTLFGHEWHICDNETRKLVIDWLTFIVTLFDKTLYSTRKKSREVNIIFQRFSRHLKIGFQGPGHCPYTRQSFRPFGFIVLELFKIIRLQRLLLLSVPDEGYSRNASCAMHFIVNIIFQRFSRHLKIEMVFLNYLKSSSQSSSG
jgi:hypothetical protein